MCDRSAVPPHTLPFLPLTWSQCKGQSLPTPCHSPGLSIGAVPPPTAYHSPSLHLQARPSHHNLPCNRADPSRTLIHLALIHGFMSKVVSHPRDYSMCCGIAAWACISPSCMDHTLHCLALSDHDVWQNVLPLNPPCMATKRSRSHLHALLITSPDPHSQIPM